MERNKRSFWYDDAAQFLAEHAPGVSTDEIVTQVRAGALRWTVPLSDSRELWLLRLSNPVVERDEIFLGNVLFNDWLSKSLKPVVEEAGLGLAYPLTNSLDTAYFLVVTDATLEAVTDAYRAHLLNALPDLFFRDDDPERGLHGDLRNMFTFRVSNREPFPVFAIPYFLNQHLYREVWPILLDLVESAFVTPDKSGVPWPSQTLQTLGASIALFFSRTGNDMQSFPAFLSALAARYSMLQPDQLRDALRLEVETVTKTTVEKAIGKRTKKWPARFDETKLRTLLREVLQAFADAVAHESSDTPLEESWLFPYLRRKGKFVDIAEDAYMGILLHRVMLGESMLGVSPTRAEQCRVCGDQPAVVDEKNILLGISTNRFYNQRPNQSREHSRRLCARCALYAYLAVKQLGSTTAGQYPIPRKGNLIFHYGPHSTNKIEALGRRVTALAKAIRRKDRLRGEHLARIRKQAKEERQPWTAADEQQALVNSLMEQLETGDVSREDLERLQTLIQEMPPAVDQTLSNTGSVYVLDIGLGDWRLMAFAVEHLRDENELAQRRFAHGRLTVFTLMSFLQEVCGCSGPYYFQSPPRLAADRADAQPDTFYVRDRPVDAERHRRRYRAASGFAWRVISGHGQGALRDRLKLSDDLERAPLETFSSVLRDSPLHVTSNLSEAKYQPLRPTGADKLQADATGVRSGWEYLRVLEALHQMAEEVAMGNNE